MHTVSITEISGIITQPLVPTGDTAFVLNGNRDASFYGINIGDVIENKTKGTTGVVMNIVEQVVHTDLWFNVGDFYLITLATPSILKNEDGPITETECKICGFSRELDSKGRCKDCRDKPFRA